MKQCSLTSALMLAAAAILTACSGVGNPAVSVHAQQSFKRHTAGGAFSAYYTGTYTAKSCGFKCTQLTLTGTGHAPFLHKSAQSETLKTNCAIEQCTTTGDATLTSDSHPGNSVTISLWSEFGSDLDWGAVGGSGKFADVKGTGYWNLDAAGGTYTETFSGYLDF